MKKLFAVIKAIQAISGWTWSDETGASIDYTTADSWDAYVMKHKDAKQFRNTGWIHLAKVSRLMPSSAPPRGANVFRPSDASTGPDGAGGESQGGESPGNDLMENGQAASQSPLDNHEEWEKSDQEEPTPVCFYYVFSSFSKSINRNRHLLH
jgi:hypothetical protein